MKFKEFLNEDELDEVKKLAAMVNYTVEETKTVHGMSYILSDKKEIITIAKSLKEMKKFLKKII